MGYCDETGRELTPYDLAVIRARRILFHERATPRDILSGDLLEETCIQGVGTPIPIRGSPFLALYHHFGSQRQKFLEAAWITAIAHLKLGGVATEVTRLELALTAPNALAVSFVGTRRGVVLSLDGVCDLNADLRRLDLPNPGAATAER
jgi:hypothetical protein